MKGVMRGSERGKEIHSHLCCFTLTANGLGKEEYRRSPPLSPGSTSLRESHHTAVGLALGGDSSGGLGASSEGWWGMRDEEMMGDL